MLPLSNFRLERWNTIKCILNTLIDILWTLRHSVNLAKSEFNEVIIEFTCMPSIRIVVSSANSIVNNFSETPTKSLIHKMNNQGPNMDP